MTTGIIPEITKKCSKCGEIKFLSEFYKSRTVKDGRRSSCKMCQKEKDKEYYEKNKEKIKEYNKEYQKEYYEKNKEEREEYSKKYYEKNKEKKKEYREKNKEKAKEYREKNKEKAKEYREKNKEYQKEYQERNKEKTREYYKKYREKNKEKTREYQKTENRKLIVKISRNKRKNRPSDGTITVKSLKELMERQNYKCYYCGEKLDLEGKNKYHLDHYVPFAKNGIDSITNVVYACKTCNLRKNAKMPNSLLLV